MNDCKAKPSSRRNSRCGQTMIEYILAFTLLLGVVFATYALVAALQDNSSRSLDLVASEYP